MENSNAHLFVCIEDVLLLFRDKTEPLMELSEEKRNEIKKAENARFVLWKLWKIRQDADIALEYFFSPWNPV